MPFHSMNPTTNAGNSSCDRERVDSAKRKCRNDVEQYRQSFIYFNTFFESSTNRRLDDIQGSSATFLRCEETSFKQLIASMPY